MKEFEIKLTQSGEITILPDSQKLFGYLMSCLSENFGEEEVSNWVRDVLYKREVCMISNLLPYPYLPTPKDYILKSIEEAGIRNKNEECIEQIEKRIEAYKEDILQKENKIKEYKEIVNKSKEEKEALKKLEEEFVEALKYLSEKEKEKNSYSRKKIYEAVKRMDYLEEKDLIRLIQDIKNRKNPFGSSCSYKAMEDYSSLRKRQTYVQKFKLASQKKQLPGFPNVAYSLPILQFIKNNRNEEDPKGVREFHFFVRTGDNSLLANLFEGRTFDEGKVLLIGPKASQGYNRYLLKEIKKCNKEPKQKNRSERNYLNIGMLLPAENSIDWEKSSISLYTSERRPFHISAGMDKEKVISFIGEGSVVSSLQKEFLSGESIRNPYNLMYKNAIVFGNSYLKELEVSCEKESKI